MEAQSRTSIDRASLARIATLAVAQVDGLETAAEPTGTAVVEVADDGVLRVSLAVRGRWGTDLPSAADRVRAEVVRVVAAMTGLHVGCVDVEVTGLLEPDGGSR